MKTNRSLTLSAILIAFSIIIPMFMPKIIIPPASYTIASHVPLFIALFISPTVAILVALGSALGFFITTPFIIALRALSHTIFAIIGSLWIQKHPDFLSNTRLKWCFNIVIGLIHATMECLIVYPFLANGTTTSSLFVTLFLSIGVGGFIHSLIDFEIATFILKRIPTMV